MNPTTAAPADFVAAGALSHDNMSSGVSRLLDQLKTTTTDQKLQKGNTNPNHPPKTRLVPSRVNSHRKFQVTYGLGKQPVFDTRTNFVAAGGSSKDSRPVSNPFEDSYASSAENEAYQPSNTVSSGSSFTHPIADTPDTGYLSSQEHDFFKGRAPPEKKIRAPGNPLFRNPRLPPRSAERRSDGSSSTSSSDTDRIEPVPLPQVETRPQRSSPLAETAITPEAAIKQASEVQRVTVKDQKRGKRNIVIQKYMVTVGLVALNTMFIFSSWYWSRYYYVYLPFIAFPLVINCIMIASISFFKLRNTAFPEKLIEPDHVEDLVYIMPCYNETFGECSRSLDSLVSQTGIDDNKKAIMVVCDGRVRGPGMDKTTADYLLDDIFASQTHREKIKNAYQGWNGDMMDIEVARGSYKGVPYFCIVKDQNQGKRDSLIVVRSFLYKFNIRHTNPAHIFSPQFFHSMSGWLSTDVGIENVDHLVGMDADTVFDTDCISELLKESKYPDTVGVCGYVVVDFSKGNWNPWFLYQNAEYTIAQGLRRLHQSVATKKVSCLPGCCQLLRICEYTCGDKVLVDLFGYHPMPLDGMLKQIRATASEDRNHVCLMLTTYPKAQTRQALRARAFTDVPHSWSVYLSQRRRWTLGATSNDLLLFTARHCQWWERILAFSNVLCWSLNIFIVAAIGCMIVAFMSQPWWIIMAFAGVMIIPLTYYIIIAFWLPRTWKDSMQYLVGLFIFVVCGPLMNITVMLFAVYNMDSFGWGKTRLVVSDEAKTEAEAEKSENNNNDGNGRGLPVQREKPAGTGSGYDEEAMVGMTVGRPGAAHLAPTQP